MTNWTEGYVADIGYTYGYYHELNPQRVKLAFLNHGYAIPDITTACELGFGQGVSINVHAASSNIQWYGTDFNPSQAGFAQELAAVSGSEAKLFDDSFLEFSERNDLPEFDFIALHGIWSWINNENRKIISNFIKNKLKVGGVVYMSYNTLPGWSIFAPMRHLMTEHALSMSGRGIGSLNQVSNAIDFCSKLLEANPLYAKANPSLQDRFNQLKTKDKSYLAHEYFNKDWCPMYFTEVNHFFGDAKLQFACSAHFPDHITGLNFTKEQMSLIDGISDTVFKEQAKDFIVNQQFRRDYWVKGLRRITPFEQGRLLRQQRFVLVSNKDNVELKTQGALGEVKLDNAVYEPILTLMGDHKIRSIGEIESALEKRIKFGEIVAAVILLTGVGHFSIVQEDKVITKAKPKTDKLNEYLMDKAQASRDISYLASPVTGSAVGVNRFHQLFAAALLKKKNDPVELATYAWTFLKAQNQKLVINGKTLMNDEDNINELTSQASVFIKSALPIYKILKIM